MSDFTHADLLAACQRARVKGHGWVSVDTIARNAHVDDIEARLALHVQSVDGKCGDCCHYGWPCPVVRIDADRLRTWGALE
jgi:hypothetical protein